MSYNRLDLAGQKFFQLTVISLERVDRYTYWLCRCDCGADRVVRGIDLRNGSTVSCGCWKRTVATLLNLSHGHGRGGSRTPENHSWQNMIQRCTNPKNNRFADWGGRGITVCERWRHSFENFLADMGRKPSPAHSIERRDNDGNYEPGNCRWATRKEQRANQRPARRAAWSRD